MKLFIQSRRYFCLNPLTGVLSCGNVFNEMARINIYLSDELQKRLGDYREREWGNHHSLSAIVQKAIKQFLDREEKKDS